VNERMTEVLKKPLESGRGPFLALMPVEKLAVIFPLMYYHSVSNVGISNLPFA